MTEKEKMLSGELYLADKDDELLAERMIAKKLCFKYNRLGPEKINKRQKIIFGLSLIYFVIMGIT